MGMDVEAWELGLRMESGDWVRELGKGDKD